MSPELSYVLIDCLIFPKALIFCTGTSGTSGTGDMTYEVAVQYLSNSQSWTVGMTGTAVCSTQACHMSSYERTAECRLRQARTSLLNKGEQRQGVRESRKKMFKFVYSEEQHR